MSRWIESPVGGYWTISAEPGPDLGDVPPARLQGSRPEIGFSSGAPREVAELPAGELCRFLLDDEPLDLTSSSVERVDFEGDGVITFLVPTDDSSVPGRPLRLHLHLDRVRPLGLSDQVVAGERFRSVDCLQHDGAGTLRLSVWGGLRRFPAVTFAASSLWWAVELLDARRPPYLLVMTEHSTDGLWDLATVDCGIKNPLDLSEVSLPSSLKHRIRRWHDRWEDGGRDDRREAEAIAEEIRRCWPDSVVTVHP